MCIHALFLQIHIKPQVFDLRMEQTMSITILWISLMLFVNSCYFFCFLLSSGLLILSESAVVGRLDVFFICFHWFSFFFVRKKRKSERPAGAAAMSINRHVLYVLSYLSPSSDLSWDFLLSSFSPFWAPRLALFLLHLTSISSIGPVFERYAFLFWFIQNVLYNFRIKYLPWVCIFLYYCFYMWKEYFFCSFMIM